MSCMSAEISDTQYILTVVDGRFGHEEEVDADENGLYIEGGTIPWEWILKAHMAILNKKLQGQ